MSTTATLRERPVAPGFRLRRRAHKLTLTAHVATSVGWLGGAYATVVLAITAAVTGDRALQHDSYVLMGVFDYAVVLPLAVASLVTGVLLGLGTKWGVVRYLWVRVKLLATIGVVLAAMALRHGEIVEAIDASERGGQAMAGIGSGMVVSTVMPTLIITALTVLSTFKPWGRSK